MKAPEPIRSARREWAVRFALLLTSLILALVIAELASRVISPVSDGRSNVALDGRPIKGWLEPGSVYRQVSAEYDAVTTITDRGYRAPAVAGNPDVIFLGDSFTYGYGLSDDETFASQYCKQRRLAGVNLGMPGSGTLRQVERLQHFLDRYGWHPKEVRLFFFGMSGSFSAGNDFKDNYDREHRAGAEGHQAVAATASIQVSSASDEGLAERMIGLQPLLLRHSNLLRLAKFHWGPLLKSMLIADPGATRMREAVAATERALDRLDELSKRSGFEYRIYLIVPVQDIVRGTDEETLATLRGVARKPVVSTANLFRKAPRDFYYSFDGHLNPRGSRRIAEFLVWLDEKSTQSK